MSQHKNLTLVGQVMFGRGAIGQLDAVLAPRRMGDAPMVFLVDHAFRDDARMLGRVPLRGRDRLVFVDVSHEPTTGDVDGLRDRIRPRGEARKRFAFLRGGGMEMLGPISVLGKLAKAELGRADAVDPRADNPRFEVPFTAAAPGRHEARVSLDFYVCTDAWCVRQTRTVAIPVDVK